MLAFAGKGGERRVQPDPSDSTLSTVGGMGLEVRRERPFVKGTASSGVHTASTDLQMCI